MYDLRLRPTHALCALLLGAVSLLSGCAGLTTPDLAHMSPEAIKEMVKDKNASIFCMVGNTPYGKGSGLYLNLDRGVVVNGDVTIESDCKVTIKTSTPPKP